MIGYVLTYHDGTQVEIFARDGMDAWQVALAHATRAGKRVARVELP